MASSDPAKGIEKSGGSKSRDAKVADIRIASRTLAEAADFSEGYGETMQHHINQGKVKPAGRK